MTNDDAPPLIPPASAQVVAEQLIAMVDNVCDRYGVPKDKRLRARRGLLMKASMVEALRMAAREVHSLRDADNIHWLADAIEITLPPAKPAAWREDLTSLLYMLCAGGIFLLFSVGGFQTAAGSIGIAGLFAGVVCLTASILPLRRLWLVRKDIWNGH